MAKLTLIGKGNVSDVSDILTKGIENSGMTTELVDYFSKVVGDVSVCVMVFEKYFMRVSNRVSLTITVMNDGDKVFVSAISAAGSESALFSFSWGAEESFIDIVPEILSEHGFS